MSVTIPRILASQVIAGSPATTGETIICQVSGVSVNPDNATVLLHGAVAFTAGTAATQALLRFRAGPTVVSRGVGASAWITVVAGDAYTMTYDVIDVPGPMANGTYILTLQMTAATAVTTINQAYVDVTY